MEKRPQKMDKIEKKNVINDQTNVNKAYIL